MRLVQGSLRFIIPLSFVAIWALTWLFTRDHQHLPTRPRPGAGHSRRRFRFNLKQLILAVALLCVVLAGVKAYRERIFSRLAAYHAQEAAKLSQFVGWWPAAKTLVDYHSRRKRTYEQATFLSIIPDEPSPLPSLPPPPAPTPITAPKAMPRPPGPSPASGDSLLRRSRRGQSESAHPVVIGAEGMP